MLSSRRFPIPWSVEDNGAAFIVKNNNGQKLAYVYYQKKPGRRSSAKLLTKDEARRPFSFRTLIGIAPIDPSRRMWSG